MEKKEIWKTKCILGIDFGEKKIGLAIKYAGKIYPEPFLKWKNRGDVIGRIVSKVKELKINAIAIGIPFLSHQRKSSMTLRVEEFALHLRRCLPQEITIYPIDEIYSSRETEERLRLLGKNDRYIETNKDSYAAVLILERLMEKEIQGIP